MKNRSQINIITIDGPAGSGKSTISRILAKKLNYSYLDTGAMYRAVALEVKRRHIGFDDNEKIQELCNNLDIQFKAEADNNRLFLGKEDISGLIRSPEMDMLSSKISALEIVRRAMTYLQRKIGEKSSIVAEGRDMGTVVFPQATHKFFITASIKTRAERRYNERISRSESISKSEVEKELIKRDDQDINRSIAPLHPAEDANIIDTTELNPEEVIEKDIIVN